MEWIKSILSGKVADDQLEAIITQINSEFPKHAVPKDKYNEASAQSKQQGEKVKELEGLIAGLKSEAGSVETYKQQIAKLQADTTALTEKYQKELSTIGKKTAVKDLLVKNKAHDDALDLLVEAYYAGAELDDKGAIKDADKLVEKIKAEKKGLFVAVKTDGNDKNPAKPTAGDDTALRSLFGLPAQKKQ